MNKHVFTGTAPLPAPPQPLRLALILPAMVLLTFKDDGLHVQGLRPQPDVAEAASPRQALAHPGLLESGRMAEAAEHKAFPAAEQAPKLNLHQLHRAAFGIEVL